MSRALLIQLARLGDLVQSLPVLTSLQSQIPEQALDLLCPSPLVDLGKLFSCVDRVFPWDGDEWHTLAAKPMRTSRQWIWEAQRSVSMSGLEAYSLAYNLNNHPRGILAAHLCGARVIGPGEHGPLNPALPPWAEYLRRIAQDRGNNRVHLADAFCGLCQVPPPSEVPEITPAGVSLPLELEWMVNVPFSMIIGIILGAGDTDRRVPLHVWQELIGACAERIPDSYLVLLGGEGEREAALALEGHLPAKYANRVVNGCGRTSFPQLAAILHRCQWVVGSDTGPLHLGTMCGARAIGWYFSRARVHETGPYGQHHYVWQYDNAQCPHLSKNYGTTAGRLCPDHWPVVETVQLLQETPVNSTTGEWTLWTSHRDEWGAFYSCDDQPDQAVTQRQATWDALTRCQKSLY